MSALTGIGVRGVKLPPLNPAVQEQLRQRCVTPDPSGMLSQRASDFAANGIIDLTKRTGGGQFAALTCQPPKTPGNSPEVRAMLNALKEWTAQLTGAERTELSGEVSEALQRPEAAEIARGMGWDLNNLSFDQQLLLVQLLLIQDKETEALTEMAEQCKAEEAAAARAEQEQAAGGAEQGGKAPDAQAQGAEASATAKKAPAAASSKTN